MRKLYFMGWMLLLCISASAQQSQRFSRIPASHLSHPELGKTTHASTLNEPEYELVHERTRYSRTFVNKNTTKTKVQSSTPLHYKGSDGFWHTIDYSIKSDNGRLLYPANDPVFMMQGNHADLVVGSESVLLSSIGKMKFVSGENVIKVIAAGGDKPRVTHNRIESASVQGIDKRISLYNGAIKYDYIIGDAGSFPQTFDYLSVQEDVTLPKGFSLRLDYAANSLAVIDASGNEVMVFQPPVVTDGKQPMRGVRTEPYVARYQLFTLAEGGFRIGVKVDASWLQSPERVFPIIIDPVVTLSNNDVINSCYFPNYQQAPLSVDVPAGEVVLTSQINYDFIAVAGSGAWKTDQRSFVSGPGGQSPVAQGVGSSEGMHTYTMADTPVGNGTSDGQVTYTFHISRNWGGAGCNATYNFVNRREVAVTYGTVEFGDGPVVINEYSASNRYMNDSFGRNEDWIELYNTSPDTYFNLAGYHISNNINNPTKWQIQDGIIPPNSRVIVYCSNRGISSGTSLHASFDLTQTINPDEVVFADPSGNVLDWHNMFVTQTNHSYGRTTDGASTWSVFPAPSPGLTNVGPFNGYTTKPTFSLAPGRYLGPITVSLVSAGAGEQIRYTTDGSTPTDGSTLYTGPISVTQSTVIRARSFSTPDVLPGFIETNTYFINENSTLPTVSLSGGAQLNTLFSGTQIEPIGYLEYFSTDGTLADETMGDFDKHGNDSWAYAQRGVDFIARDDHGYKRRLEHQFFDTTDRGTFRRLIFKAAGSDNYPHQSGGAHLRDVFAQKLSEVGGLELDERRSTFVSLFVNGVYWGVYDMREKVDDNQYTDYYYNQDYIFRDSDLYIQYIKTWGSTEPEFGNQPAIDAWNELTQFVQNNDMSVQANYDYVDSQLNIDSLIDYFVLNSYLVNKDWLNWNTSWWRGLNPSGGALKWRYALWDVDGILGHYINYTGIPDISADAPPCQAEEIPVGIGHTQTIGKLIEENPGVRHRYITRYVDLFNTHLSCDAVTELFDSLVAQIAPEMPRQIQRWGGSMAQWQANVQSARDFLLERCSQSLANGMNDCYDVTGPYDTTIQIEPAGTGKVKFNSEWLTGYPFVAQVFGNIDTMLKAQANPGYEFSHWVVDGAPISPDAESEDIVLQISQATTVTAHFAEIVNVEQALYYWHFNTLVTPADVTTIAPDYSEIPDAGAMMTYTGSGSRDIDAAEPGSVLNTHFSELSGRAARVRNPSEGRSLLFDLPTTGFKEIKFAYAVQRTNNGMLNNNLEYSIDGTNFTTEGMAQSSFVMSTDFILIDIDLSAIDAVNDNPNFKIRITFEGNTTGDSGNNRFDNITLKGIETQLATRAHILGSYQVYPNPFTSDVRVITTNPILELCVFDMVGKKVWEKKHLETTSASAELETLNTGVYLLKVKTTEGIITHKIIKI